MLVGVLGAVIVRDEAGHTLTPGGPARRHLLAALAARAGQAVPAATLIEDLWGASSPPSAAKTLHSHIARLRRDLGAEGKDILVTDGTAYRLALPPLAIDSGCFERDLHEGTAALAAGDPAVAWRDLEAASHWWRGDAYADVPDAPFAAAERARLHELRALAQERRIDAGLQLGRGASLVGDIEAMLLLTPLRERLWEQLIIALYRADRQADALAAFHRARAVLLEGLGIEPGQELRRLQQRVLAQDEGLRSVAGRLDVAGVAPVPVDVAAACPYVGLAEYEEADSVLFVARERMVSRLVDRLGVSDLLVVTGDSGAGKSSAIRAGLLPALRTGALPGSALWTIELVRPAQLGRVARDVVDLVIVDQAEELFTLDGELVPERLDHMIAAIRARGSRLLLVIRADFYGRLAELPELAERAGPATEIVSPLTEEELQRVVIEPARRTGLAVEPELVEQVLADVRGQPGALPLLSVALLRTWQKRHGSTLSISAYRAAGGLRGAIEATAEDAYAELPAIGQAQARRLLVRLAARHGSVWTRQPMPRDWLGADERLVDGRTLELLARRRIVTLSADRVELVHEALLDHWPRLRGWLDERAAVAELAETLAVSSQAWADGGRRESDLIRGARLQAGLDWQNDAPDDVSPLEAEFLAASKRAAEGELALARERAAREARGRRRLRYLVVVLAVVAATAITGVVAAVRERGAEQRAAQAADARRVAALSLTAPDLRTSLLLAVAAYRLDPSPDARGALLSALQRSGTALWRLPVPGRSDSFAVAGSQFWTMDQTRTIYRYDFATRRQVASFPTHADHIAAVSPDGRLLIVEGQANYFDTVGAGRVTVLNAAHGAILRVLPVQTESAGALPADAVITSDGHWLAVVEGIHTDPADPSARSPSRTLAVFDAHDLNRPPRRLHVDAPITGLAADRDGFAVSTDSGSLETVRGRDLAVTAHATRKDLVHSGIVAFSLSPDGAHLAVTFAGNPALPYLLDTRHLAGQLQPLAVGGDLAALAFSPSSRLLALSATDGSVDVVRSADGSLAARPLGPAAGQATELAWTGTAAHDTGLYAAGPDGQVIALDVRAGARMITAHGRALPEPDEAGPAFGHIVDLGPTSAGVRTSTYPVRVIDPDTGRARVYAIPFPSSQNVQYVSLDAAGDRALFQTQDQDGVFHTAVIALPSGHVLGRFEPTGRPSQHNLEAGVLAADGRTAVYAVGPHRLAILAMPGGHRLRTIVVHFRGPASAQHWVSAVAFAPDGRLLVMGFDTRHADTSAPGQSAVGPVVANPATADSMTGIVNLHSGRLGGQVGGFGVMDLPDAWAWSPDGTRLVIGSVAGTIRLVDAHDLAPLSGEVPAAAGYVQSLSFSPDGRTVVSGGSDGTMRFWNSQDLQPLASPIRSTRQDSWWAWYRKDGELTGYAPAAAGGTMRWFTMPGRDDQWIVAACKIAATPLTHAEWSRYVGSSIPYRQLC